MYDPSTPAVEEPKADPAKELLPIPARVSGAAGLKLSPDNSTLATRESIERALCNDPQVHPVKSASKATGLYAVYAEGGVFSDAFDDMLIHLKIMITGSSPCTLMIYQREGEKKAGRWDTFKVADRQAAMIQLQTKLNQIGSRPGRHVVLFHKPMIIEKASGTTPDEVMASSQFAATFGDMKDATKNHPMVAEQLAGLF